MSAFEFFFGFYGLILGLSVVEVVTGFSKVLKQRRRIRIGYLTPMLALEPAPCHRRRPVRDPGLARRNAVVAGRPNHRRPLSPRDPDLVSARAGRR